MRHEETKEVPQKVVIRSWTTCDMCQKKIEKRDLYEIKEGEISLRVGSSYPEGGSATVTRADICENCFRTRLIPWLDSQGVTMQEIEEDW